jgi:hypothetical protein
MLGVPSCSALPEEIRERTVEYDEEALRYFAERE